MAHLNNFDANTVDPAVGFDPIPAGKYVAVISKSEEVATKAGNGHYLKLEFDIVEGQYRGRKLWARLNIDNPSAQAVQIARGELSAICHAVGVMRPQDSVELHNLPLTLRVACKTRKDTGEISNEISGYEKKEAALASSSVVPAITQPPANVAAPVTPQTPQAPGNVAPWNR